MLIINQYLISNLTVAVCNSFFVHTYSERIADAHFLSDRNHYDETSHLCPDDPLLPGVTDHHPAAVLALHGLTHAEDHQAPGLRVQDDVPAPPDTLPAPPPLSTDPRLPPHTGQHQL